MTHRTYLLPYNMGSQSARALAKGLGIKRIYPDRNYKPRDGDVVINWGFRGNAPVILYNIPVPRIVNSLSYVHHASNKLTCLNHLNAEGVNVPNYSSNCRAAYEWLDEGYTVVERHTLHGHSGEGIVICNDEFELGNAPLYTKYQKKTHEYRVHVMPDGSCILNQKRRRTDVPDEDVNWQVRNYDNGFTYCRDNVEHNQDVIDIAKSAVDVMCLDFGAVDVIHHAPTNTTMVLEINTAPGLEGSLLDEYIKIFGECYV